MAGRPGPLIGLGAWPRKHSPVSNLAEPGLQMLGTIEGWLLFLSAVPFVCQRGKFCTYPPIYVCISLGNGVQTPDIYPTLGVSLISLWQM